METAIVVDTAGDTTETTTAGAADMADSVAATTGGVEGTDPVVGTVVEVDPTAAVMGRVVVAVGAEGTAVAAAMVVVTAAVVDTAMVADTVFTGRKLPRTYCVWSRESKVY